MVDCIEALCQSHQGGKVQHKTRNASDEARQANRKECIYITRYRIERQERLMDEMRRKKVDMEEFKTFETMSTSDYCSAIIPMHVSQ